MTVFDEIVGAMSELGVLSRAGCQGEKLAGGYAVTLALTGSAGLLTPNEKRLAILAGLEM